MKKILTVILAGMFLCTSPVYARHKDRGDKDKDRKEQNMDHAKMIDERMEHLTKDLNLTADQQKQVREALNKKMESKMSAHKEMGEKMEKLEKDHQDTMKSILNDEQEKKYMAMKKDKGKECCDGEEDCPHHPHGH